MDEILQHFGIKRRSGRYPFGSGQNPYQHEGNIKRDRRSASENRRSLSTNDLNERIKRLEAEKKLKDLTDADLSPGRKAVKEIIESVGKDLAKSTLKGSVLYGTRLVMTGDKFSFKEYADYVANKPKKK